MYNNSLNYIFNFIKIFLIQLFIFKKNNKNEYYLK